MLHSWGSPLSQAITVNVSTPESPWIGVYVNEPSAATTTLPERGSTPRTTLTASPSGSVTSIVPETSLPVVVSKTAGPTVGGLLAGSTSTLTPAVVHSCGAPFARGEQ